MCVTVKRFLVPIFFFTPVYEKAISLKDSYFKICFDQDTWKECFEYEDNSILLLENALTVYISQEKVLDTTQPTLFQKQDYLWVTEEGVWVLGVSTCPILSCAPGPCGPLSMHQALIPGLLQWEDGSVDKVANVQVGEALDEVIPAHPDTGLFCQDKIWLSIEYIICNDLNTILKFLLSTIYHYL